MIDQRALIGAAVATPLATAAWAQNRRRLLGVLLTGNETAGAGKAWSAPFIGR